MTDLKVLILARGFGSVSTGPGKYATVLADGLRKRQLDVTVVSWGTAPDPTETSSSNVIHITRPALDLRHGNWMMSSLHFRRVLDNLLTEDGFDVLHFTEARDALFFRGRTRGCVVGSLHDYLFAGASLRGRSYRAVYPLDYRRRLLYYNLGHLLEGRTLRRMDHLIATSKATASYVRDGYRIQPDRLTVVHNGLDPNPHRDEPEGKAPSTPSVLFIGNNFQGKGLSVLIRASPLVLAERGETDFLVVGSDPKAKAAMQNLCERYGVSERFDFKGLVPHHRLPELFAGARVLAQPSLVDSFPYSILEAMSWGVPPVATNIGGIPELVSHGESGFLIEPHDHEALARYISLLIEDDDIWGSMREACRRSLRDFSVNEMINRTIQVYDQNLELKRAAAL